MTGFGQLVLVLVSVVLWAGGAVLGLLASALLVAALIRAGKGPRTPDDDMP